MWSNQEERLFCYECREQDRSDPAETVKPKPPESVLR